MTEPAKAEDADSLVGSRPPAGERRIGGDPRAQERRGILQLQTLGDLNDEALVDNDLLAVPALGRAALGVARAVRSDPSPTAVLFVSRTAIAAHTAGFDEASDAGMVTGGEPRYLAADRRDDTGDLVAGDERKQGSTGLVFDVRDVGVADAAVGDIDQDVARTDVTSLNRDAVKALSSACRGQGVGFDHVPSHVRSSASAEVTKRAAWFPRLHCLDLNVHVAARVGPR